MRKKSVDPINLLRREVDERDKIHHQNDPVPDPDDPVFVSQQLINHNASLESEGIRRSQRIIKKPIRYDPAPQFTRQLNLLANSNLCVNNFFELANMKRGHQKRNHSWIGCGSISANHIPDYYNSLRDVIFYNQLINFI